MGKKPPKWLPGERVDETILMQRKSVEQLRADRMLRKTTLNEQKERMRAKKDLKRKQKLSTKRFLPAQVVLKQAEKKFNNTRRFFKAGEKFDHRAAVRGAERLQSVYDHASIGLVVRAKGNMIPPETKRAFAKLGLDKIYKARLVHLNRANHKRIQQLRRFIILGYPTNEQLERLVRTRGCFWSRETKSKSYISGNLQVEEKLGHLNILSISELVDAVVNKVPGQLGPILSTLAPFDFHPPRALHVERHRSVHEKLEVLNPASFAQFLDEQLGRSATAAVKAASKKLAARAALSGGVSAAAPLAHPLLASPPPPVVAVPPPPVVPATVPVAVSSPPKAAPAAKRAKAPAPKLAKAPGPKLAKAPVAKPAAAPAPKLAKAPAPKPAKAPAPKLAKAPAAKPSAKKPVPAKVAAAKKSLPAEAVASAGKKRKLSP